MTDLIETQRETGLALPHGWRRALLRDVLQEAQGGFASGKRDPNGIIQLRMNNVTTRGGLDWSSYVRVPRGEAPVQDYLFRDGDVLFNNTNSTELVGKTALFENHREPVVFSNHFTRLRTKADSLLPAFLAFWLRTQWQEGLFERICNRWIGQSAVQRAKLLALEIPLPTVEEQKRIVGILNEQIAVVERAQVAAEAQLEAATTLPAAYLRTIFNSREARDWPRKPLGKIAELLPSKSISTAGDCEVRTITTACLSENGFLPRGIKSARMRASDAAKSMVSAGEILVARSNTPELVGRAALFLGEVEGVVASDLTIRIRMAEGFSPAFVAAYLSFLYLSGYWKERAGGASGSMKKITRTHIQAEPVPVPNLDIQLRIAIEIVRNMESIATLASSLNSRLGAIGALPATLLRRAFNGEV